jgi:hypothetical protein
MWYFNVKDAGVNRKRKLLFCWSLYGQNKQPTRAYKATKRLQHQNRTKYQTIDEEIRLQLTHILYLLHFKLVSCLQNASSPGTVHIFSMRINNIWHFLVIFEFLFSFIFISNYKINLHSLISCLEFLRMYWR